MISICDLTLERRIAVVTICSPPVNALSQKVCQGLHRQISAAVENPQVRAIVILCAGKTFCAGAEISELGKELEGPDLLDVAALMDQAPKPIVAAIHGTALGGGLELALAAHYRIAVPSAQVGLPEVSLGLLPGGGGTQRLPRIVGIAAALELIALGRPIDAHKACAWGILDRLVAEDGLRAASIEFAEHIADRGLPRVRDRQDKLTSDTAHCGLLEEFRRQHASLFEGFKAPANILEAIRAAATLPFDQGMRREAELFQELLHSTESAALRYVFFAERAAAKVPDVTSDTSVSPISRVGVLGAGDQQDILAASFAAAGLQVMRVDAQPDALLQLEPLAACDLVITTVSGRRTPHSAAHGETLDRIIPPQAILAVIGSAADLSDPATDSKRAARVAGLHFFAPPDPAHGARGLLEIARTRQTDARTVASLMRLARKLGSVGVLSMAKAGFIAARMATACAHAARTLRHAGLAQQDLLRIVSAAGLPGHLFETDPEIVGDILDPPQGTQHPPQDSQRQPPGTQRPCADRQARPALARDNEVLERLLAMVASAGRQLLDEGVALRSSDIDITMIHAHGWPVYRGGPMWWAGQRA